MAKVKKLFTGHQALRPIPVYTNTGEQRAITAAAAAQKPRATAPLIKRGPSAIPGSISGTKTGGTNPSAGTFTGTQTNHTYD